MNDERGDDWDDFFVLASGFVGCLSWMAFKEGRSGLGFGYGAGAFVLFALGIQLRIYLRKCRRRDEEFNRAFLEKYMDRDDG